MVIPHYPDFKALEIDDRLWIGRKLRLTSRQICELSPGNIFIWKDFDHTRVTCINDNVCMQINPPNEAPYFLEPVGGNKIPETVKTMFELRGRISRVSKHFTTLLPKGAYTFEPLRNQFDYLYLREELAQLKGKKFDGKRNHIKRFRSAHHNYQYWPFDPAAKDKALALFEKWFAVRQESKFFPRLAYTSQKGAIVEAFRYFKELHLLGGMLWSDHKLMGFTIGSAINPETISVHFLYGDPEARGSSQTMLWQACSKTYHEYKIVDLEQDLGIPGLRSAKLSYHPLRLEEKFEVRPHQG